MPKNSYGGTTAEAVRVTDRSVSMDRSDISVDFRGIADAVPALLWVAEPSGESVYFNSSWYEYTGQSERDGRGFAWLEAVHPDDRAYARESFRAANAQRQPFEIKYRLRHRDGADRWVVDAGRPRFGADGSYLGFVGSAVDIHDHTQAESMAAARARQQQVVAELGTFALRNLTRHTGEMQALMDQTVTMVADTLDIEFCKVLELLPGGEYVLLVSGVGWQEGLVGYARVDTGADSQAGYTLLSDEPVVVEDLRTESRFSGPALLTEHGVLSGMSCVITGIDGEPWGVLGAHTRSRRLFTPDDVHFLQAIANLLGAALQRQRTLEALGASEERLRAVLDSLPVGVIIANAEGRVLRTNAAAHEIWNVPPEIESWEEYEQFVAWWPDTGERIGAEEWAMTRALRGEMTRDELILNQKFGSEKKRYFLNSAAPVRDADGRIIGGVVAMLDVTERVEFENALREHKEQLEDRVQARTRQVRQLAATLSRAEQNERARIAQVLHDEVQQLLYALKIQVKLVHETSDAQAVHDELADAQSLLQQAIDSTRRLTLSMNPPVLREEGLAAGFRWLAAEMGESYPLRVELDLVMDEHDPLSVDERALVLHTVRELLFNVVKHAGVDRAELRATIREGELTVEVRDHGTGFDPREVFERRSRSFGLGNIRERLRLNGGGLELHTGPDAGTRAVITVPVGA